MAGTTTYYGVTYPTSTDYVKDGATAIQTVATGFDSAVAIPTYNAQTGTTYTFALTDVGKTVTASNAGASTYTIPPTASVAWPTSTTLNIINLGAGVVTFAAGAGVTVTNTAQTLAQYQSARLVRTGLNAWTVTPNSGGSSGLVLVGTPTVFSATTSATINNCFSSTYDNYRIILNTTAGTGTTGGTINWQTRNGGTTDTSSVYSWNGIILTYGGAVTVTQEVSQPAGVLGRGDIASPGGWAQTSLDVYLPFLANYTSVSVSNQGISSSVDTYSNLTGKRRTASSHDGIAFTFQANTTGTIYVYGYAKA
jgi:hypothetical protein